MRAFLTVLILFALASFAPAAATATTTATYSAHLNQSALPAGQSTVLAVALDISPGFHTQSHTPVDSSFIALNVSMNANPAMEFSEPIYPAAEFQNFLGLGRQSVYTGRVIVYVPIHVKSDAAIGDTTISGKITWQACNANECFLPKRNQPFSISSKIVAAGEGIAIQDQEFFAGFAQPSPSAPTSQPAAAAAPAMPATTVSADNTKVSLFGHEIDLKDQSLFTGALVAFIAGIIFNVVPCVLPVLPVKAIGFYEAAQHSRARTLLFGAVFSLGLIAVFASLGMIVLLSKSLFGHQLSWGEHFSHPIFGWSVAVVVAALGFGMLGAFSFELPSSVYGLDFRHDTLPGNFLWGALTAVLSTPCTGPLFPPVLALAQTLPRFEGFILVVLVGAGMASPYFLLSAFPELARKFPRTGQVSELVKQMMGFLLLATAAFFVGFELLGEPGQWWLIFAVIAWAALYLIVRGAQIFKSPIGLYVTTAIAVTMLAIALLTVLRLTNVTASVSGTAAGDPVQWQTYSAETLADARQQNRLTLIDFTADWCLNCKYVEQTVFRDPRVLDALRSRKVLTLKADLSNSGAPGEPLLAQLGGQGIPYTAVYLPGTDQPVGIDSIYTADTLLGVLGRSGK